MGFSFLFLSISADIENRRTKDTKIKVISSVYPFRQAGLLMGPNFFRSLPSCIPLFFTSNCFFFDWFVLLLLIFLSAKNTPFKSNDF